MADLDVNDIVDDPDFAVSFTVIRRPEATSHKGRSVVGNPMLFRGILGTITRTSPNDMVRDEDGSRSARSITIVTRFPLRGVEKSNQPDQIDWNGDIYTVQSVDAYRHFGQGFVEATAQVPKIQLKPTN